MQLEDLILQMMFRLSNGDGLAAIKAEIFLRLPDFRSEVHSGSLEPPPPVTPDSALTSNLDLLTLSCLSESSSEMKRA